MKDSVFQVVLSLFRLLTAGGVVKFYYELEERYCNLCGREKEPYHKVALHKPFPCDCLKPEETTS